MGLCIDLFIQIQIKIKMKKLHIISWVFIISGVIMKFTQAPDNGIVMFLGAIMLLLHSVLFAIHAYKNNLERVLFHFSVSLITIYFYGRIYFFSWSYTLFYFSLAISLVFLGMAFRKSDFLPIKYYVFIMFWMFFMVLPYVPSYKIHQMSRFSPILREERKEMDYYGWDKQSWFLYLSREYEEALHANDKAAHAARKSAQLNDDYIASEYLIRLEEHRRLIVERKWDRWINHWEIDDEQDD